MCASHEKGGNFGIDGKLVCSPKYVKETQSHSNRESRPAYPPVLVYHFFLKAYMVNSLKPRSNSSIRKVKHTLQHDESNQFNC
jgi:hypothetical protein